MQSNLELLKSKLGNKGYKFDTQLFILARELGCLPEIIGREYEFIKDEDGQLLGFRQKPMNIPQFRKLMDEFKRVKEIQKK